MQWFRQKTSRKLYPCVNILVSLYPLNIMLNRLQSKDIYITLAAPMPSLRRSDPSYPRLHLCDVSPNNYELDQVKTLKFFRLNCPGDKVTITHLAAGLLPVSQTLALIAKLTRHEPVNRTRTYYRLAGDGQIIDNQAICCDYRSHHQQCAHNE